MGFQTQTYFSGKILSTLLCMYVHAKIKGTVAKLCSILKCWFFKQCSIHMWLSFKHKKNSRKNIKNETDHRKFKKGSILRKKIQF